MKTLENLNSLDYAVFQEAIDVAKGIIFKKLRQDVIYSG